MSMAVPGGMRPGGVSDDARAMMLFEANKKAPVIAYLLWFFLGLLGAHNFYLKRTGVAVAQLILTLTLVGIVVTIVWTIVDAFLIPGWVRRHNTLLASQLGGGMQAWMAAALAPSGPSFWSEFLSLRGRASRSRYWLTLLVVLLISIPFGIAVAFLGQVILGYSPELTHGDYTHPFQLVNLALTLGLSVPLVLAGMRRLQDRGKSPHWGWLFFAAPLALGIAAQVSTGLLHPLVFVLNVPFSILRDLAHSLSTQATADQVYGYFAQRSPYLALGGVSMAISVWALIELGCLRGTVGSNRFGTDPLERAAA
jgi:uncharacterized membrane protein YhaH (DUF805 family)/TM2 domain-containing membrane protein YozV